MGLLVVGKRLAFSPSPFSFGERKQLKALTLNDNPTPYYSVYLVGHGLCDSING